MNFADVTAQFLTSYNQQIEILQSNLVQDAKQPLWTLQMSLHSSWLAPTSK
jgi:hypothetical protein